jgi:hypothetical protein
LRSQHRHNSSWCHCNAIIIFGNLGVDIIRFYQFDKSDRDKFLAILKKRNNPAFVIYPSAKKLTNPNNNNKKTAIE